MVKQKPALILTLKKNERVIINPLHYKTKITYLNSASRSCISSDVPLAFTIFTATRLYPVMYSICIHCRERKKHSLLSISAIIHLMHSDTKQRLTIRFWSIQCSSTHNLSKFSFTNNFFIDQVTPRIFPFPLHLKRLFMNHEQKLHWPKYIRGRG